MNTPVKPDELAIPYALPQVPFMSPDMVHPGVMTTWLEDDNLWVPVTKSVSFKPLLLSVSGGYYINLLRVRQSGVLSRHRHSGAVHAIVLKGRWYYLEHDWVADEGSFAFEPPGETHTLFVPEDVEEMITGSTFRVATLTSTHRVSRLAMKTFSPSWKLPAAITKIWACRTIISSSSFADFG
jgi:hypothetical protein